METLDLVQLHCPPTDLYYRPEVFDDLDAMVAEGRMRAYGVSVERVEEALKAIEYPNVASVQIIFNAFRQRPASLFLEQAAARGVGVIVRVPLASGLLSGKYTRETSFAADDHRSFNRSGEAFDVGETFAGVPFEAGLDAVEELRALVPDGGSLAALALRWILMHDAVTTIIPGARSPEQAEGNAAAAERAGAGRRRDGDDRARLPRAHRAATSTSGGSGGRHRRHRRRDARLRVHGQGPRQRLPDARLHDVAAAAAPALVSIAGRDGDAVGEAAGRYGFAGTHDRLARGRRRSGRQLFDNVGPNGLHGEPTIAAAEAGKHVVCEKPLGRNAEESHEIWRRVDAAGVKHMCAFNYRFVPAIRLARELIEAGEIGEIHHFRARYLQEWITDPNFPMVWRLDAAQAGSGALGDLGAHIIDLGRYLVGEIDVGERHHPHVHRRPPGRDRGRRRRLRGDRRVRERRGRDAGGVALRAPAARTG